MQADLASYQRHLAEKATRKWTGGDALKIGSRVYVQAQEPSTYTDVKWYVDEVFVVKRINKTQKSVVAPITYKRDALCSTYKVTADRGYTNWKTNLARN